MKTARRIESGYTHFVGVIVPEDIAETVESCRSWMRDRYGCRSGHRTPPHITLVAPFAFSDERGPRVLEDAIAAWASIERRFPCELDGFGAFAERTVFARVVASPEWARWHSGLVRALNAAVPAMLPPDRGAFTPHLTVANRDIPAGGVPEALSHFAELSLHEHFIVDHAALFEWGNGAWYIRAQIEAGS
jgi:2'-5' RNA ligase